MRKCFRCMKDYSDKQGYHNGKYICPYCGFAEGTPPKELNHLYPGTILQNRYVIGIVLGFGGFGITYKAWDYLLNRIVAIKEYYPNGLVQRVPGNKNVIVYEGEKEGDFISGMNRFLDEARKMSKFSDNKNVVCVDNFYEENNTAYIVMEYLDGISLKEYLKQENGKIDCEQALYITFHIIDALEDIHKAGILHRDISPDNIFLCENGIVKLIDFGAARFSDEEKEITRSIILKPGFSPPEQYQSKSKQGSWTDIYALSATLYSAITGVTPDESVNRIVEDEVKSPKELDENIPEYISNTIMKGMAINPSLRFRDIKEFRKALSNQTKVVEIKEEIKKRKRKRVFGIAGIAALLLAGGLTIFYLIVQKKNDIVLDSSVVTIWICIEGDEDADREKQMIENMADKFLEDQPAVEIEVVAIDSDYYSERLYEADENGTMPTIYEASGAPDEIIQSAASIDKVFDYTDNLSEDYFLIDEYKEYLSEKKQIPMGFNVPVVYVRTGKDIETEALVIDSYVDVADKGIVDERYKDIFDASFSCEGDMKCNTEATALLWFADNKISYYMATVKEFSDFNSNVDLAGLYEMKQIDTEEVYGYFTESFCIDGSASDGEIRAAQVLLSYMLAEGAQKEMYVSNKNTLPLNKAAYEVLLDNNQDFKVLDAYMDKLKVIE